VEAMASVLEPLHSDSFPQLLESVLAVCLTAFGGLFAAKTELDKRQLADLNDVRQHP